MMNPLLCAALTGAVFTSAACAASKTFYLSPRGSDAGDGTKDRPFATFACAQNAVREAGSADVEVCVLPGRYETTGILFETKDSGRGPAPVVYSGEGAEITSAKIVPASAFLPVTDSVVLARVSPAAKNKLFVADLTKLGLPPGKIPGEIFRMPYPVPELFFNGQRMPLARWPNEGWATIPKIIDQGTKEHDGSCNAQAKSAERPRGGTFQYDGDRPAHWDVKNGVWLHGFWCFDWYEDVSAVASIDTAKKTITFKRPHIYGLRQGNPSPRRWRALNLLEELDQPGEYCVDTKANQLYFWPPAPLAEARVTLPFSEKPLLSLQNVTNVVFKGFTFHETQGNAVNMMNCQSIVLDGCTIRNIRRTGIEMENGISNLVCNCDLSELGCGGVKLAGGNRKTLSPGGNVMENTHIWNYAVYCLTYASAVAVGGVGNIVRHNELSGAPHMAVGMNGNDHVFEYNIISNVCMASDDAAAFYKGRNPSCRGNIIRYNYWADIGSPRGHGNAAIYFDDGDGGETVYGNVFYRCGEPGKGSFGTIFSHGGHDNIAENCIFIECKRALGSSPWNDKRWKAYIDADLWQRLLLKEVDITKPPYTTRYPALAGFMTPRPGAVRVNHASNNLFVNCREAKSGNWETNASDVAVWGDPGFVNYAARDFRLKPDARAFQYVPGFKPIPMEQIGMKRHTFIPFMEQ